MDRLKQNSLYVFVIIILLVTACSNAKQKRNDEMLKVMEEGMIVSNQRLDDERGRILRDAERKLADPLSHDLMSVWKPRIVRADKLSDSLNRFIFSLRDSLYAPESTIQHISEQQAGEIYRRLLEYKKNVFDIDSSIAEMFTTYKSFVLTTASFDSTVKTGADFYQMFFADNSIVANSAMLFKLMNNIKHRQVEVIDFLNRRVVVCSFTYDSFKILASQSATHLRAHEMLRINAGLGAFSSSTRFIVTANGVQKGKKTDDGDYEFYMKAPAKPGKHKTFLNIQYVEPDGKMKNVVKEITYYVDSIPTKQ